MNWSDIQAHWPDLKARIRAEHPEFDTDELERTDEGRRQLLQLIEARYGATGPMAEEEVDEIVKEESHGRES